MFGGLLASAIANMQGVRGYNSWRWVFILEGIATILIGIVAYFLVADFPTEASWLSGEEREFVLARTAKDDWSTEDKDIILARSATDDRAASRVTVAKVISFFGSVKNLLGGFMYFGKSSSLHYTYTLLKVKSRCHCPNILYILRSLPLPGLID